MTSIGGWRIVLATLVAVFALAGCGLEAPTPPAASPTATPAAKTPKRPPVEFLTEQAVSRYPAGTPSRVAMEIWRAIQYRDILTAWERLTTDFRRDFAKNSLVRFSTYVMADHVRWLRNPRVVSTFRGSRTETAVYLAIPGHDGQPEERLTFSMRRENGRWLLGYDFYLANRLSGA